MLTYRAIIYWVYNSVMVLPSKKYIIDYNENSYRYVLQISSVPFCHWQVL